MPLQVSPYSHFLIRASADRSSRFPWRICRGTSKSAWHHDAHLLFISFLRYLMARDNPVMFDIGRAIDKKTIVLGIIVRKVGLFAGKPADGIHRLPPTESRHL